MSCLSSSTLLAGLLLTAAVQAGTPSVSKAPASQPPATPAGSHSLACPLESLGECILHPKDPYQIIPGRDPSGWSFTLEPYLWAIGVSGDVGVKGLPPAHVKASPKEVLQNLDWGLMARGEIRKGRWGLLGDGLFAQISASEDPADRIYRSANVTMQQGLATAALAYRVIDDRRGFLDVYAGARYNYLGVVANASVNNSRVNEISDTAANRIVAGAIDRAEAFLRENAALVAEALAGRIRENLTDRVLLALANPSKDLGNAITPGELRGVFSSASPEVRELAGAVAAQRIAVARNTVTTAIQNRVAQAERNLSAALAKKIDSVLPTRIAGDVWWVDPIVGLRGHLNFTRWLFLAVQGDAGGFGAGSQIAWNAQASLGVNITRNIFGELGYRCLYTDYVGSGIDYKVYDAGVFAGLGVKF